MKNSDLYQTVVGAICRNTGYAEASLLRRNIEGCVDARYILIHLLGQWMTDEEIARETGMTRQSVNYIKNHFDLKQKKWSIRSLLVDISKEINTFGMENLV